MGEAQAGRDDHAREQEGPRVPGAGADASPQGIYIFLCRQLSRQARQGSFTALSQTRRTISGEAKTKVFLKSYFLDLSRKEIDDGYP